jgi:DNA invertase Pin-like site-specific DNA recombinase
MNTANKQRAAVYIRCATHNEAAAAEQLKECKEYIERKGYQYAGKYIDMSASGIRNIRSAFDAMTIDAHIGEIDRIIVVSMARISRKHKKAVAFCADIKESCGVIVEAVEGSLLQ